VESPSPDSLLRLAGRAVDDPLERLARNAEGWTGRGSSFRSRTNPVEGLAPNDRFGLALPDPLTSRLFGVVFTLRERTRGGAQVSQLGKLAALIAGVAPRRRLS